MYIPLYRLTIYLFKQIFFYTVIFFSFANIADLFTIHFHLEIVLIEMFLTIFV